MGLAPEDAQPGGDGQLVAGLFRAQKVEVLVLGDEPLEGGARDDAVGRELVLEGGPRHPPGLGNSQGDDGKEHEWP
jgi:hypothetical protein